MGYKPTKIVEDVTFIYLGVRFFLKMKRFFRYHYIIPIIGFFTFLKDLPDFKKNSEQTTFYYFIVIIGQFFSTIIVYGMFTDFYVEQIKKLFI